MRDEKKQSGDISFVNLRRVHSLIVISDGRFLLEVPDFCQLGLLGLHVAVTW